MLSKDFSYRDKEGIKDYLDYLINRQQREQRRPQNQTNAHALTHYESLLRKCKNIRLPFGSYPTFQDLSVCYGETVHTSVVERLVKIRYFLIIYAMLSGLFVWNIKTVASITNVLYILKT